MRVLVLGAGVSGRAAGRLARRLGYQVTVYDQDHVDTAGLFEIGAGVVTGAWDRRLLDGVDVVVASPGFSERSLPVVETLESGVPIWSEIELAWRQIDGAEVVAVTGTNGKTTVTEATSAMLVSSGRTSVAAGNIGTALSDVVQETFDVIVAEVSSFQLRFVDRFHPRAAALINLAADHLDWHGSVQAYAAAKSRIFARQTSDDLLVFDADDPGASAAVRPALARLHPVSGAGRPAGGSGVEGGSIVFGEHGVSIDLPAPTPTTPLVNLVMAGVLALEMGASKEGVTEVVHGHRPGAHRRVLVGSLDGVDFVDDSKATNPHAALASIASFPSVVLIAGGLAKGLDLRPLVTAPGVRGVIAIGAEAPALLAAAGDVGRPGEGMDQAVRLAFEMAAPGDTVLLAPGAASFDEYPSFAARGQAFAAAFEQLKRERS